MNTKRSLPESRHFHLQRVEDGVYAAIHKGGGAAIGNAGIVDLGDRTLIFDSMYTPMAGRDLRAAAETLLGRPVDIVVNSHYHNDHIWGNQVFEANTDIVSTIETRRLIVTTRGHDDFDTFMANAEANLESTRDHFTNTQDKALQRQLAFWIDYHRSTVEAKPILQVRAPNITFTGRMVFHGSKRSAELIDFGEGHSPSDTVLFLPTSGIAFMSDLLFIAHHPYIGAGNPQNLLNILGQVSMFAPRMLVPGHGPPGAPDSLVCMIGYLNTLTEIARRMVKEGKVEEQIDRTPIPKPYADWLFSAFFPLNMHALYQDEVRGLKASEG